MCLCACVCSLSSIPSSLYIVLFHLSFLHVATLFCFDGFLEMFFSQKVQTRSDKLFHSLPTVLKCNTTSHISYQGGHVLPQINWIYYLVMFTKIIVTFEHLPCYLITNPSNSGDVFLTRQVRIPSPCVKRPNNLLFWHCSDGERRLWFSYWQSAILPVLHLQSIVKGDQIDQIRNRSCLQVHFSLLEVFCYRACLLLRRER